MCFSATASFSAATVLTVMGAVTLKQVKRPSQLAFAAIPIIFAIQQFSEGFVWLNSTNPQNVHWQHISIYTFLAFSHVLWQVWVPLSVLLMEKEKKRKRILFFFLGAAILLSATEGYCLFSYPSWAEIDCSHILYQSHFPEKYVLVSNIMYGVVTLIPCFISGTKRVWLFGLVLIVSVIAARIFYEDWLVSVWCFFAALLSGIIYLVIKGQKETLLEKVLL